jgi:hypothetical protein
MPMRKLMTLDALEELYTQAAATPDRMAADRLRREADARLERLAFTPGQLAREDASAAIEVAHYLAQAGKLRSKLALAMEETGAAQLVALREAMEMGVNDADALPLAIARRALRALAAPRLA